MTQEEIIKNNKLIAEYMGLEKGVAYYIPNYEKHCKFSYDTTNLFFPEELKYHESWDWLMPVIEKLAKNTLGVLQRLRSF